MLVADLDGYERLRRMLGEHPRFGLTLDIGHRHCVERDDLPACVRRALPYTVHVQIEDMRRAVHEHLEFGEGEIDFVPVLAELRGYLVWWPWSWPGTAMRPCRSPAASIDFLRRAHEGRVAGRGRPAGRG